MEIITFVPGAVLAGNNITIPTSVPGMDSVSAAQIVRLPASLADHPAAGIVAALVDHPAADIVGALADHAAAAIVGALAVHAAAAIAAAFADHAQAAIAGALADHAVHAHALEVQAGAAVEAFGASGAGVADLVSASGQTIPGGVAATGIQNIAAAQAHAAGAAAVAHAAGVAVVHVVGAAPVVHGVGAAPVAHAAGVAVAHVAANSVVAAVPTLVSTRIITLSVNTLVGDLLILTYNHVGERVLVS